MPKIKTKSKTWTYFLIGLFVAIISMLISIPFSILLGLLTFTDISFIILLGLIIWIPLAFIISGWVIVNVVQWFGFKKK